VVVTLVPLSAGKMLAIYTNTGTSILARCWNGSAWSAVATCSGSPWAESSISCVSLSSSVVGCLYIAASKGYIDFVKYYSANDSFGTPVVLSKSVKDTIGVGLTIDSATGNLYAFYSGYTGSSYTSYMMYNSTSGVWGSQVLLTNEASNGGLASNPFSEPEDLTSFYQAYGGYIGVLFQTGSSPISLRFAYLSL
jgi:hypothetical protein